MQTHTNSQYTDKQVVVVVVLKFYNLKKTLMHIVCTSFIWSTSLSGLEFSRHFPQQEHGTECVQFCFCFHFSTHFGNNSWELPLGTDQEVMQFKFWVLSGEEAVLLINSNLHLTSSILCLKESLYNIQGLDNYILFTALDVKWRVFPTERCIIGCHVARLSSSSSESKPAGPSDDCCDVFCLRWNKMMMSKNKSNASPNIFTAATHQGPNHLSSSRVMPVSPMRN